VKSEIQNQMKNLRAAPSGVKDAEDRVCFPGLHVASHEDRVGQWPGAFRAIAWDFTCPKLAHAIAAMPAVGICSTCKLSSSRDWDSQTQSRIETGMGERQCTK
jgi:hypothetical protein